MEQINFYNTVARIDDYLKIYSSDNFDSIIKLFNDNTGIENYFYYSLSNHQKPFDWFNKIYDSGFFLPDKIPIQYSEKRGKDTVVFAPYWNVLGILGNVIKRVKENPDSLIDEKLKNIFDKIISARINEKYENYRADYFISQYIFDMPLDYITEDYFRYYSICIQKDTLLSSSLIESKILSQLIFKKAKFHILKLLQYVIFKYKENKQGQIVREYRPVMEDYNLKEIVDKYSEGIVAICGNDSIELAVSVIEHISKNVQSSFNQFEITSLENNADRFYDNSGYFPLVNFIVKALSVFEAQSEKEKFIINFLNSEIPILNRIGYFIIGKYYDKMSKYLWDLKENPIQNIGTSNEFFQCLKNNAIKLRPEQIKKYISWIEGMDFQYYEENIEKYGKEWAEKNKALSKRIRLEIIKENQDLTLHELIKKYKSLNDVDYDEELELKGFKRGVGFNPPQERESVKEFINLSVIDIIKYLNDEEKINKPGPMNKEGVGYDFEQAIIKDPEKHIKELKKYASIKNYWYQYLVSGFMSAYEQNPKVEINNFLDFIQIGVISEKIQIDDSNSKNNFPRNYFASRILSLLNKGTNDDAFRFDEKGLKFAEEIAVDIYQKTIFSDISGEVATDLINPSNKLASLRTLILISLCNGRNYNKEAKEKWTSQVKQIFSVELKTTPSKEFFHCVGAFYPNLRYLDKDWADSNLHNIFNFSKIDLWKAAFSGYLIHSRQIFKPIFENFKKEGLYHFALKVEWEKEYELGRLIDHIYNGYLMGSDTFEQDNSIIGALVSSRDPIKIKQLILRFSIPNKDINSDVAYTKILWGKIYDAIHADIDSDPDLQVVAGQLVYFIMQIKEIDEQTYEWIKMTAKYVKTIHQDYHFIKALFSHSKTTTKYNECGKLYVEMLNSGALPTYKQDQIISFVELLYQHHLFGLADEICNLYGEKGEYFLRDLYFKNNIII